MTPPLHVTTADRIEADIRSGVWAPGSRLLSERELSRALDVSRSTLRLALDDLELRGLVTRHQGRGTFVARSPIQHGRLPRVGRPTGRALEGRTILVTGSTGIAAAAAERVADDGARVFVTSRTAANCAALAARLRDAGAEADHLAADLADEVQARHAVDACRATFGRIDGLLAVAGGSGRRFGDGPLHTVTGEAWDATLALNARSQALVLGAVLRVMLEQSPDARGHRGAIILVTSVLASDPVPTLFATHAYAAAKGAVDALVRTTAAFYAPWGIRVNGLAPALTDTPMAARAAADPATVAFAARKQPLAGGFVATWDVAGAARFLLSDEAAMITGQRLVVDGGWSVTAAAPGDPTRAAG
ncbi:MAG TPA: SDR family oxidoreductase [Candidatus Limnocylindrales bacterium]|jgi:NAD(P)-dependent dehydrogenase (short-subunit alcohol dehydrogenase family)